MAHTPDTGGFEQARRPITSPALFDLAPPAINIRPIPQVEFPDKIPIAGTESRTHRPASSTENHKQP